MSSNYIHITETLRDAVQGWKNPIRTEDKIRYISQLLRIGFDTVDIGSFVSPKAVPQMADTAEVISEITSVKTRSELMVVTGNTRGAMEACKHEIIRLIGFPYSTSPTFLHRNIHSDPQSAWTELQKIREVAVQYGKHIRVYISMAFGNPYGDPWSVDQILKELDRIVKVGFTDIAFSDITGEGSPEIISDLCNRIIKDFGGIKAGIHLHSKPDDWQPKVEAAWQSGFRYFEGVMGGHGGCPMTGYELLGNLDTAQLFDWCRRSQIYTGLDEEAFSQAVPIAREIFS